jgi:hypothetical protein
MEILFGNIAKQQHGEAKRRKGDPAEDDSLDRTARPLSENACTGGRQSRQQYGIGEFDNDGPCFHLEISFPPRLFPNAAK